jgi:5-methylthioadenosine/S-adenosylhomocysteine deaminase
MIRSGTTLFADHYFMMDEVALAVQKSGMKGALAEAILEFGNEEKGKKLAKKGRDFVKRWNGKAEGRVTCLMGPHSTYTCTPNTLKIVKEYAQDLRVPIHLHLEEFKDEASQAKKKWGKRPVELLESIGFLGPDVLAAHVIFVDDKELGILARRKVNVNNNVYCMMKGGQGIARAIEMMRRGINVSLGTDGPASHNNLDMFEEMKLAIAAQALKYGKPDALDAQTAIRMATINGARALHLEESTGSIEKGKDADLVVLSGSTSKSTPFYNPPVLVAQTLCGGDVTHTMVKGKLLLENGKLVSLDEDYLVRCAEKRFVALMDRSGVKLKKF